MKYKNYNFLLFFLTLSCSKNSKNNMLSFSGLCHTENTIQIDCKEEKDHLKEVSFPLHKRILARDLKGCQDLISNKKICINNKDIISNTPLHLASSLGYFEIVEYLISNNACLASRNCEGNTPLHNSCSLSTRFENDEITDPKGLLKVIELLISNGAEIGIQNKIKNTPLHFASSPPIIYLKENQMKMLEILVKYEANLKTKNINGDTPLHIAARYGLPKVEKYLIEHGAPINEKNYKNWTALHYATSMFQFKSIRYLVSKGANIYLNVNCLGWKPIHWAAFCDNLNEVKKIIDNNEKDFNLNVQTEEGYTPLICACMNRTDKVSNYLLLQNKIDVNIRDKKNKPAISWACAKGLFNTVKKLIDKKALINVQDQDGWTPLQEAAFEKEYEIVNLLIKNRAKLEITENNGISAIHWACYSGSLKLTEYFYSLIKNLDIKDHSGKTPLFFAAEHGHYDIIKFLHFVGCNIFIKDKCNNNLLHTIANLNLVFFEEKHYEVVRFLIKKGLTPSGKNNNGLNAINLCLINNNEVLKIILTQKC